MSLSGGATEGSSHYPYPNPPMADPPANYPSSSPEQYRESEAEDVDNSPPKKKRRRQALSCTECKRRKIKCDRNQPCAPCTRRGDQDKCQWHIIEPLEKYVTRQEFDDFKARYDELRTRHEELKTRFNNLESMVHRLLPSSGPPGTSTAGPPMSPSAYGGYHMTMPGEQGYQQEAMYQLQTTTPPYPMPRGPSLSPLQQQQHPQHSPTFSRTHSQLPVPATPPGPSTSSRSPVEPRHSSPQSSKGSLASITSPFQSKNYHAQTSMVITNLGGRLRICEGPAGAGEGAWRKEGMQLVVVRFPDRTHRARPRRSTCTCRRRLSRGCGRQTRGSESGRA